MKFYNAEDIQKITGLKNTASYDLIKQLQKSLIKEYPGTIVLTAKIQKWYFDLKMLPDKREEKENEKEIEC